ncbi:MAG: hypothetical protein LBT14_13080 [Treponema sp.]|jgi:hypothetical protein|nr:hypothetical protein [Treponema sp.]
MVILFLMAGVPGFSASLEELIGPDRRVALIDRGSLMELQFKASQPLLIPRHAMLQKLVDDALADLDSVILAESLYRYTKPAGSDYPRWSESEQGALFNAALALSTLAGIQYYSSSRKTMRTFYETSVVIDGPETKRPLADPVYLQPPAEVVLYARQKDSTFGDTIYQYDYHALSDALIFVQQNITAMSIGIIPAMGKHKLRSIIAVIDAERDLLIYAASMAQTASIPGMKDRIGKSFSTRIDAMLKWFAGQADTAFGR